MTVSALLQ